MTCVSCGHLVLCHETYRVGIFRKRTRFRCNAIIEQPRRWPDTGTYQERCKCDQERIAIEEAARE